MATDKRNDSNRPDEMERLRYTGKAHGETVEGVIV